MNLVNPSILITDDDRDLRDSLCDVFDRRGFTTLQAEDGQQALEIVSTATVHVMLIDMNMPHLSGLQVIQRTSELELALPCLLMSAQMNEMLAEQALAARAFAVHSKPFGLSEIRESVEMAMENCYEWFRPFR